MATEGKKAEFSLSEQFPINVLCNFISPYKGDRETLNAFLTNCQNALDLASPSQKTLLNKYILSRLESKAQIACSNKIFEDFNQLKCFLKQNFGERKHYNHLLLDLQSCKQQLTESVSQFALRVESCVTDLQSEIYNSDSLKKDIPGRIAMTEDLALFSFSLGLHSRLSNNVRCRSPKNLNDAINIALEEEKIQNLLYKTNIAKSRCKTCGKAGHTEAECFSKDRRSHPSRDFSKFQNKKPFNTDHNQSSSQAFCRYCKKDGHDIKYCYRRKYNNEKRNSYNNHSSNYNKSADAHHITYEPPSPPSPIPCANSCENVGDNTLN